MLADDDEWIKTLAPAVKKPAHKNHVHQDERWDQMIERQAEVDPKTSTYFQPTVPDYDTLQVGDLWFDTHDNQMARWDGWTWETLRNSSPVTEIELPF